MYEIIKDIDAKTKFFTNLYLQEILILGSGLIFIYITRNLVVGYLSSLYFIASTIFLIYTILPSLDNKNKRIIDSIIYSLFREKGTIKSIDRLTYKKENETKKLSEEKYKELSRKEKRQYNKERKNKKIRKSTLDYIDYLYFDDRGFLKHKEGYMEILEIIPQDLMNLNEENTLSLIHTNSKFYLSYKQDIKIISMNFPVSFVNQIEYLKNLLSNEEDTSKKEFLKLKIDELEQLQETRYNKEFYIVLFSQNEVSILEDTNLILKNLSGLIKKMDLSKKEKILFKLNNMNTKI